MYALVPIFPIIKVHCVVHMYEPIRIYYFITLEIINQQK